MLPTPNWEVTARRWQLRNYMCPMLFFKTIHRSIEGLNLDKHFAQFVFWQMLQTFFEECLSL